MSKHVFNQISGRFLPLISLILLISWLKRYTALWLCLFLAMTKPCGGFVEVVLEYNTNKIVHIKNKKIGLINRIIQLVIISYVIG